MSDSNDGSTEQPIADPPSAIDEWAAARSARVRRANVIVRLVTVIVAISLFSDLPGSPKSLGDSSNWGEWSSWLLEKFTLTLLAFILLNGVVTFVKIFSFPLPHDGGRQADGSEGAEITELKRRWMTFAYGFMLFALFAAITPFIFDIRPIDGKTIKRSPISVLVGCVETNIGIPGEMQCASGDTKNPSGEPAGDAGPSAGTSAGTTLAEADSAMWIINLGGEVRSCEPSDSDGLLRCRVQGGLVIPVYLVILALFGGAISLTRRVPEYQKQAADGYVATESAPKLEPHRLRECLIFQIVQFISAPFIAVVAYYVFEPTVMSTSVALAFAAGFASESILLIIRAGVDKIKPVGADAPSTGSVTGYVTDAQGQVIEGAEVQIFDVDGKPTVSTDAMGCFALDEIPTGEHALKVQHAEANKTRIEQIRVQPGAASVSRLML